MATRASAAGVRSRRSFLADAPEVGPDKRCCRLLCALAVLPAPARPVRSVHGRDCAGENAVQKTAVFGGNLRVPYQLPL